MGLILYNLFLYLYRAGISLAAIANPKARKWLNGRKEFPEFNGEGKTIWMHCASLGEFEQGRPVIEALRLKYPEYKVVITFFSPSGYEIRKNYSGADAVFYLPEDSMENARRFIDSIRPVLVVWVKYEFWYYYLTELKHRNVPVLLISAIFRDSQPFFKWYGGLWKKMLGSFRHIFVQNVDSVELLQDYAIAASYSVSGDTRFDRVTDIAEKFQQLPLIERFCSSNKVIVAGSTWEDDETELIHYVREHPEIKFIIAPHEVDKENLEDVKKEFTNAVFFSHLPDDRNISSKINVLIIDNIGMLSKLYRYATVAYVGGGFNNSGIHNVLEAAVYGKPVIFGPVYRKFAEARGLVESGAAFSISNAPGLEKILNELLNDTSLLQKTGDAAAEFVKRNCGATQIIINYIAENRLLIN